MRLQQRVQAFVLLGKKLKEFTQTFYDDENTEFQKVLSKALIANQWFVKENQLMALKAIAEMLDADKLEQWLSGYPVLKEYDSPTNPYRFKPRSIGAIMAGNIPAVGFHDLMCVLISGNTLKAKCASDDKILLPWLTKLLIEIEPAFAGKIIFCDKLSDMDAVIATGSNNSARYFDYYFSKYPHIIRKNRNAVAVLSGNETKDELKNLGKDIFSYFGLGCRNVSKLYVPEGYDFNNFYAEMESFSSVMQHNKYMNNYDYQCAVLLMNSEKFLTNNFLIIKENKNIATPVSVVNYEFYSDANTLKNELGKQTENIQCIATLLSDFKNAVSLGQTQHPQLWDYADGVDSMQFLCNLN